MATKSIPTQEARTPLSRWRVLHAAIGLADQVGIEALSMRRLAQKLGVGVMSLYNHVANKEEILVGILDMVLSEIDLRSDGLDWKAATRRTAISAHEVLVRHPWAAALMLSRTLPARLRYMETILGNLRQGGFSAEQTDHAYHALDSHIAGFSLWEVNLDIDPETLPEMATNFVLALPADEYPYVVEHVHEHLKERHPGEEGEFAFGLDLILDGLERLRDARQAPGP
jgi:AcrR family transcriptional regulator